MPLIFPSPGLCSSGGPKWGFAPSRRLPVLGQPELKKTLYFTVFNFFLTAGIFGGNFGANALLISRVGTSPLFYVYFGGSVLALFLCVLLLFLAQRYNREKIFSISFLLFGSLVTLSWYALTIEGIPPWVYAAVRGLFYGVFVVSSLEYWLLASDSFTNFEARRRFPFLVAAGITGKMIGGMIVKLTAVQFHAVNFILVWGLILTLAPPLFLWFLKRGTGYSSPTVEPPLEAESLSKELGSSKVLFSSGLSILLFSFWLFYSFSSFTIDYVFNLTVREHILQEDVMAAYFGKVAMVACFVILLYQVFFAGRLSLRFGVDQTVVLLPLIMAVAWGLVYFRPSLTSLALAEGAIYYFADFASVALLHPVLNVYPYDRRGAVKVFTEGFGRPAGTLLLLCAAWAVSFQFSVSSLSFYMFAATLLFLAYPFFFHFAYLKHLLACIQSKDLSLVSNAIQALGEKNKTAAVSRCLPYRRKQIISRSAPSFLGQMQSREAFPVIVELFSVRNESLQMAVVDSLSRYRNYQSMLALFRLTKSKNNVSFQVRMSATIFLTRLVGKKMIPFLLAALEDTEPRVRANAIESIGLLKDPKTLPILLPYLEDENHRIRANALIALYPFRKGRKQALHCLKALYRSDDKLARLAALFAIGELKLKSYEMDLLRLLNDPDPAVGIHAAASLGKMKNPEFCPPFLELLLDETEGVALEAIRHLGKFPRYSRYLLFERIGALNATQRSLIFSRLDKTPLDFSTERGLLREEELIAAQVAL
jgi:hypothetical protein